MELENYTLYKFGASICDIHRGNVSYSSHRGGGGISPSRTQRQRRISYPVSGARSISRRMGSIVGLYPPRERERELGVEATPKPRRPAGLLSSKLPCPATLK